MFTRMMTGTLDMTKKEEFVEAARQLRKAYADQPGFVDLLTFIGDEQPNRALVLAVWRKKSDSDDFYTKRAPLLDLKPFLKEHHIEHYHLEVSNVFGIEKGKAKKA
jgi:heme-degrading monooxygenase HmoA